VKVINTDICVIVKAKRLMKEVYKLEGDVEADGIFICDFRCVKGMVILAVTIVSVTASHGTYGVYRAVHFRFVWQLEPCCLNDRQRGDRCALCSTALTLQHSLQLNKNSTLNSQ
jgi:hypothetical protein